MGDDGGHCSSARVSFHPPGYRPLAAGERSLIAGASMTAKERRSWGAITAPLVIARSERVANPRRLPHSSDEAIQPS
jgi:hypothetical protein